MEILVDIVYGGEEFTQVALEFPETLDVDIIVQFLKQRLKEGNRSCMAVFIFDDVRYEIKYNAEFEVKVG